MAVQSDGRLVLGTYDGLRIYDPDQGVVESYNQTSQENGGLSHYAVETVYIDRARTLWVGTYAGGVNYAHAQSSQFSYHDPRRGNHTPGVLSAIVAEPSARSSGSEPTQAESCASTSQPVNSTTTPARRIPAICSRTTTSNPCCWTERRSMSDFTRDNSTRSTSAPGAGPAWCAIPSIRPSTRWRR